MSAVFGAIGRLCQLSDRNTGGEIARILRLPLRHDYAADWTDTLRRPNASWRLNAVQNAILTEARIAGGVIAFAPVGSGKSLACFCLPTVLGMSRAIVLQPGSMRSDWARERITYSRQFIDPGPRLEAVSYATLSQPGGSDLLTRLRPDLIIADEVHKLGDHKGRALSRVVRYIEANPTTRFVGLSGTLESNTVKKFWHLFALALRHLSPMPLEFAAVDTLSSAIDPRRQPNEMALNKWEPLIDDFGAFEDGSLDSRDQLRAALRRRLVSSQGVVIAAVSSYAGDICVHKREPVIPESVEQWLKYIEGTWTDPDGFEFASMLDLRRKQAEISQGFFYRILWPKHIGCTGADCGWQEYGIDTDGSEILLKECRAGHIVDVRWIETRKAWNKAVRGFMPDAGEGVDSDALAGRAAEAWLRYYESGGRMTQPRRYVPPHVVEAWRAWRAEKQKTQPDRECVWIDGFLVYDALRWLNEQTEPSVIWVRHRAVADALHGVSGIRALGSGPEADAELVRLCAEPKVNHLILSIQAHGTGKNLQRYANGLVMFPPSSGNVTEQLIGRFARTGQTAPRVSLTFMLHSAPAQRALQTAIEDSRFSSTTIGTNRLLLSAKGVLS